MLLSQKSIFNKSIFGNRGSLKISKLVDVSFTWSASDGYYKDITLPTSVDVTKSMVQSVYVDSSLNWTQAAGMANGAYVLDNDTVRVYRYDSNVLGPPVNIRVAEYDGVKTRLAAAFTLATNTTKKGVSLSSITNIDKCIYQISGSASLERRSLSTSIEDEYLWAYGDYTAVYRACYELLEME